MGLNLDSGPSIVSDTLEDHLNHLHLILERLKVKLKPSKFHFAQKKVEYPGHVLTQDGLKPNPTLVSAVREFPVPTSLEEPR